MKHIAKKWLSDDKMIICDQQINQFVGESALSQGQKVFGGDNIKYVFYFT